MFYVHYISYFEDFRVDVKQLTLNAISGVRQEQIM